MGFPTSRQVIDGTKNILKNIPLAALAAVGNPSSTNFLAGNGVWKPALLVAPTNPAYDFSAKSGATGLRNSGDSFSWQSGGGTGGAFGIVEVVNLANSADLNADIQVKWGDRVMTRKGGQYNNNIANYGWTVVFILDGIPAGDQKITVTITQAGKQWACYGASYSYTNVADVGPLQTSGGSGSPSLAATAANTKDIIWGSVCAGPNALTGGSFSQTLRQSTTSALYFMAGDVTGVTSATFSATASAVGWSAVALDLKAAVNLDDLYVAKRSPLLVEYVGTTSLSNVPVPSNILGVEITEMIHPGAGGGSGRLSTSGTIAGGGGGGGAGTMDGPRFIPASALGTTYAINIPAPGAGGAAVSTANTDGNPGTAPSGYTSFISGPTTVEVKGATTGQLFGAGGTSTAGGAAGGVNNATGIRPGTAGGAGSSTTTAGGGGTATITGGPTGGGGGGGVTATPAASNGGTGGYNAIHGPVNFATGGVVGGAAPTNGGAAVSGQPGVGGGGGAGAVSGAAQAGATPLGYGAGGGGGGGAIGTGPSGAGGAGGPGYIALRWIYS